MPPSSAVFPAHGALGAQHRLPRNPPPPSLLPPLALAVCACALLALRPSPLSLALASAALLFLFSLVVGILGAALFLALLAAAALLLPPSTVAALFAKPPPSPTSTPTLSPNSLLHPPSPSTLTPALPSLGPLASLTPRTWPARARAAVALAAATAATTALAYDAVALFACVASEVTRRPAAFELARAIGYDVAAVLAAGGSVAAVLGMWALLGLGWGVLLAGRREGEKGSAEKGEKGRLVLPR